MRIAGTHTLVLPMLQLTTVLLHREQGTPPSPSLHVAAFDTKTTRPLVDHPTGRSARHDRQSIPHHKSRTPPHSGVESKSVGSDGHHSPPLS